MNKQEAIKKIEKEKSNLNAWEDLTRNRALNDALAIVRKINEPEKVAVPKFVAEWIEESKKCHNNLSWVWFSNPVSDKLNDWLKNHTETFMRAWLDGYEIEQEKLYTVEIPDPHGIYKTRYLFKNSVGNVRIGGSDCRDIFLNAETLLTEAEIKQDFDFLWQFAKEVE